jgi:hypothetical protein
LGIPQKDLQFLLLMHELGHWLTHWPLCFNENWKIGFAENNPMTHESLAQLIAYWSIEKEQEIKSILENHLTPTDSNNPYALYKKLISFTKLEMLMRLYEVRKETLNDKDKFDVLSNNESTKYKDKHGGKRFGEGFGI